MPPRKTNRTSQRRTTTTRTTRNKTNTGTTYSYKSPKFNTARTECQWRMASYRTIWNQFNGAGTQTQFSPTAANRWTKYVNSGVRIYKWNNTDFTKYFGSQWTQNSPTAARNYLRKKYGAAIKDVTRGKGNCWLVAATKNVTAKPFRMYNWK